MARTCLACCALTNRLNSSRALSRCSSDMPADATSTQVPDASPAVNRALHSAPTTLAERESRRQGGYEARRRPEAHPWAGGEPPTVALMIASSGSDASAARSTESWLAMQRNCEQASVRAERGC